MTHPLLPLALAFAGGIFLSGFIQPLLLAWVAAVSLLLTAPCFQRFLPQSIPRIGLLLATTCLGALHTQITLHVPENQDVQHLSPSPPALLRVRGVLEDAPVPRTYLSSGTPRVRTRVPLRLQAIHTDNQWLPCTGILLTTTGGALPTNFFRGQSIETEGVLNLPRPAAMTGLFDAATFLAAQNIHRILKVPKPTDWTLGPNAVRKPPLSDRFMAWGQQVLQRDLPENDPMVPLLWALALGWRSGLDESLEEPFLQSGTLHVFAISGLHIALFVIIVVALLQLLRLPRAWSGIAALPLAWLYVGLTGWQSSAVRSALMTTVVIGSWTLHRPSDLLNALAGAALAILAWQPGQLFLPGFQLSFGVVASMAVFGPALQRQWNHWIAPDPLAVEALQTPFQRFRQRALHWLGLDVCTSLSAWIGSVPLVWHYFHLLNPISLAANLVVVPLSSAALIACVASLVCGDWLPGLGGVFNASAWLWMKGMVSFSQLFAAVPGGWWFVAHVPVIFWVAYYLLGWAWVTLPAGNALWHRCRWVASTLGVLSFAAERAWNLQSTQLVCLAAGRSLWVDQPGIDADTLINGGSENAARLQTLPALRACGVHRVQNWILTHRHAHTLGGAPQLHDEIHPRRIGLGPGTHTALAPSRSAAKPVSPAPLGESQVALTAGMHWQGWQVLHPRARDKYSTYDDSGLVLQTQLESWTLLFCGTLGRKGQSALLEHASGSLPSDILLIGPPANGSVVSETFLDAVSPQWVILIPPVKTQRARWESAWREVCRRQGCLVTVLKEDDALVAQFRQGSVKWAQSSRESPVRMDQREQTLARKGMEASGEGLDGVK